MPLSIRNLYVTVTIGDHEIILDSDSMKKGIDELNQADPLSEHLKNGLSFKMRKGTPVIINVGELVGWFERKFDNSDQQGGTNYVGGLGDDVRGFVNKAHENTSVVPTDTTALDGIEIELSDLYFSANKPDSQDLKLSFGFSLIVRLDADFYNGLGLDKLTDIFTVDEVGFSLAYTN